MAALDELQLEPARRDDLVRQYRRLNSPFAPIYGLLDRVADEDEAQGMSRAAMLPVSRPEGMSVAEAVQSGEAQFAVPQGLFDMLSGSVGAIDAPSAAARGLIPAQDMPAEALGAAGVAMGAGGLAAAPRGALRSGLLGDDYRGVHRAPGFTEDGSTASLDRLDVIYPDDIYDRRVAARYYGHMEDPVADQEIIDLFSRLRGRPDVGVPVYRAVPVDAPDELNPGDWVTPSRRYAEGHGESALGGEYRIVEGNVPARELFTDANSIFEFGWSPRDTQPTDLSANRSTATGLLASAASDTPAQRVARLLREGRADEVTDDLMAQADPQEMFRLYEAGETGADMPMDVASRMARARGMGFDTELPLYHGTGADFQRFDPARFQQSDFGTGGAGVYSSESPGLAGAYADLVTRPSNENANILPIVARRQEAYDTGGYRNINNYEQAREYSRKMQELGVDNVYYRDNMSGEIVENVTFDPRNIRSRFARFDPRLSNLRNLNAANVDPLTGLLAIMQAQEPRQ